MFEVCDLVMHVTGGPIMVITDIKEVGDGEVMADTEWWNPIAGDFIQGDFNILQLVQVTRPRDG